MGLRSYFKIFELSFGLLQGSIMCPLFLKFTWYVLAHDDLKEVPANRLEQIRHLNNEQSIGMGSVGAARKVFPNWFILPIVLVLMGVRVSHRRRLLFRADATYQMALLTSAI